MIAQSQNSVVNCYHEKASGTGNGFPLHPHLMAVELGQCF